MKKFALLVVMGLGFLVGCDSGTDTTTKKKDTTKSTTTATETTKSTDKSSDTKKTDATNPDLPKKETK
jgi:hypothetical protein